MDNDFEKITFTHGSLFSGIGGFDLAAEWMGWENIFHCEWNEFGQKVLKYYWPEALSYNDITKTDFTIHRGKIDILTGGFPCQPYSVAGKRKGKDDERHLWPQMLRAIREIQPGYIVAENVSGLISWNGGLVFHEVQTDLEAEGYEVQPFILPACAKNAPHRRDRIWFIAHRNPEQRKRTERGFQSELVNGSSINAYSPISPTRPPRKSGSLKSNGGKNNDEPQKWRIEVEQYFRPCDVLRDATNPGGQQLQKWTSKRNGKDSTKKGTRLDNRIERPSYIRNATHTQCTGRQKFYTSRITTKPGHRAWNDIENWTNFPTQSPLCDGNDGFSTRLDGITFSKWRNESIKAGGNAIVPQVAFEIFKVIKALEKK